jgi:hypothetical protein
MDGRYYLLDLPSDKPHLFDILEDGTSVMVYKCANCSGDQVPAGSA